MRVRFEPGKVIFDAQPGRRRIVVTVSDFQEGKNKEDVPRIKPNTATLARTVVVR